MFDYEKPTGLLLGRFQPFHDGHRALVQQALKRVPQLLIGVRTQPMDADNPFSFSEVGGMIYESVGGMPQITTIQLPNITRVFYGRTPGWQFEELRLSLELEAISGTKLRGHIRHDPY